HAGADLVRLGSVEGLGAVASGEDEGLSARGGGDAVLEHIGFTCEHQRRRGPQIAEHLFQSSTVEIGRLLLRVHLTPVVETAEIVIAGSGDFPIGEYWIGV